MFLRIVIFYLISLPHGDIFDQKKILLINNLPEKVTLDSPVLKSTNAQYSKQILPNDQGIVTIEIQKDWWIENPLDAIYKQNIFYSDAYVTLGLKKRVPDPNLIKPFQPGYDCVVETSHAKKIINVSNFNASDNFCAAFYLY